MTAVPPMPVVLLGFKAIAKGSLRGFAKIRIGRALIVSDVPVLGCVTEVSGGACS